MNSLKQRHSSIMKLRSLVVSFVIAMISVRETLVSALDCIDSLQEVHDRESTISTSTTRTYILCPNKIYDVGYLDFNYNLRATRNDDGGPPIPLRPNLHIKCGPNGLRSDNCWIVGGHLQVDGTAIRGITEPNLDNVVLEGLTFQAALEHSVWITKPGTITFRQCVWTDHTNSRGPIVLDFYNDLRPSDKLRIQFVESRFHSNRYFGTEAQPSMIVANSDQNILNIERSIFHSIDMKHNNTDNRPTYLVESLGPTKIQQSCFMSNQLVGSAVAVYGNELVSTDVHLSESSGDLCSFASVFETLQQFEKRTPTCVYALHPACDWLDSNDYIGDGSNGDGSDEGDNGDDVAPVRRYAPFTINALDYDAAVEVDTDIKGSCSDGQPPIDGPDAQNNFVDTECKSLGACHIGFSMAGERVMYRFAHNPAYENPDDNNRVYVDITVRVASARSKAFRLELLGSQSNVYQSTDLRTEGGGYDIYRSITWSNVPLDGNQIAHTLVFVFVNGGTNLCSVSVDYSPGFSGGGGGGDDDDDGSMTSSPVITRPPTPFPTTAMPTLTPTTISSPTMITTAVPTTAEPVTTSSPSTVNTGNDDGGSTVVVVPATWSALDYDESFGETTVDESFGGCNVMRGDGVDAQTTSDEICRVRDQSVCNIGWWAADERLVYHFDVTSDDVGLFDVRVRSAAKRNGKDLQLSIRSRNNNNNNNSPGTIIDTFAINSIPADGWQSYNDEYWKNVELMPGSYALHLSSTTGSINVCSVAILSAGTTSDGEDGDDDNDDGDDDDDNGDNNSSNGDEGGGTNDNFLLSIPGRYSAMLYLPIMSVDMTPDVRRGNCPYRQSIDNDSNTGSGGVDAQINTDSECQSAIQPTEISSANNGGVQACNVGWTDAGESLVYDFVLQKDSLVGDNDNSIPPMVVTLRVSGPSRRPINVEVFRLSDTSSTSIYETIVYSPGNSIRSWTTYTTLTTDKVESSIAVGNNQDDQRFRVRITFLEGRVNLCSVGMEYAQR